MSSMYTLYYFCNTINDALPQHLQLLVYEQKRGKRTEWEANTIQNLFLVLKTSKTVDPSLLSHLNLGQTTSLAITPCSSEKMNVCVWGHESRDLSSVTAQMSKSATTARIICSITAVLTTHKDTAYSRAPNTPVHFSFKGHLHRFQNMRYMVSCTLYCQI